MHIDDLGSKLPHNCEISKTDDFIQITIPESEEPEILEDFGATLLLHFCKSTGSILFAQIYHSMVFWPHPHTPELRLELWKTINIVYEENLEINDLIDLARKERKSQFAVCKDCKRLVHSSHRHGNICHGCAERFHGIVH